MNIYRLTGGRPMYRLFNLFTDVVSGKTVSAYHDRLGRYWMADSGPWSLFRVKLDPPRDLP